MNLLAKNTLIIFLGSLLLFSLMQCSRKTDGIVAPTTADSDKDGLTDDYEISIGSDPYNADTDGDTILDGDEVNCKNRLYKTNPTLADTDNDGIIDSTDAEPSLDKCTNSENPVINDQDSDGIDDTIDNCPTRQNGDQADYDHDGVGDECDNCKTDENLDQADSDLDGVGNVCDNCPNKVNPQQYDYDDDGIGMACDEDEGLLDEDGDGEINSTDNCPINANADQADADGDGVGDLCDNCINEGNADQANADGDDLGDECDLPATIDDTDGDGIKDIEDLCPDFSSLDNSDSDADGVGNACDNCLFTPNPEQDDDCNEGGGGDNPEPSPEIISICKSGEDSAYSPGYTASRITVNDSNYDYYIFRVKRNDATTNDYGYYKVQSSIADWDNYDYITHDVGERININMPIFWHSTTTTFYKAIINSDNINFFFDNGTLDSRNDSSATDDNLEISVKGYTSASSQSAWSEPSDLINPYSLDSCGSGDSTPPEEENRVEKVRIIINTADILGAGLENFNDKVFLQFCIDPYCCSLNEGDFIRGSLGRDDETEITWDKNQCFGINNLKTTDDMKSMKLISETLDAIAIKKFRVSVKYETESVFKHLYKNDYVYLGLGPVAPFVLPILHFIKGDYALKLEFKVKDENLSGTDDLISFRWRGVAGLPEIPLNLPLNLTATLVFHQGLTPTVRNYANVPNRDAFDKFRISKIGPNGVQFDSIKITILECFNTNFSERQKFVKNLENDFWLDEISPNDLSKDIEVNPTWVDY